MEHKKGLMYNKDKRKIYFLLFHVYNTFKNPNLNLKNYLYYTYIIYNLYLKIILQVCLFLFFIFGHTA